MAKFRVGEKVWLNEKGVEYLRGLSGMGDVVAGTTGVVERTYESSREVGCYVTLDNVRRRRFSDYEGWAMKDEWLEPAQEGPKDRLRESAANTLRFAVGDKVVIAGCENNGYLEACGAKVGDVGVIAEAKPERVGIYDYEIRFDGNRERVVLNDAELAPYVEPAKPVAYSVGDRVKVRQWGNVRTGVVYVENSDFYKGMTCVRYDDAISQGFDKVSDVEVLEVIAKAKPVAPTLLAVGTLVRLTEKGAEFVNERMRRLRSLDVGARAGDVVEIKNSDDNDELPYRVRLAPDVPSWCRFDSIEPVVPGDFRVGDKVRVVSETFAKTTWYHDVGTVFYVGYAVCANFARSGKGGFMRGDLELVASNTPIEPYREPARESLNATEAKVTPASESKHEFRVGDKVRVVRTNAYFGSYSVGAEGVIEAFDDEFVKVRLTKSSPKGDGADARGDLILYIANEIELIAATPTPVVRTIAVSNLRFTRKGERVVVEANGKRVATVSVEELRKMCDEMTKEEEM